MTDPLTRWDRDGSFVGVVYLLSLGSGIILITWTCILFLSVGAEDEALLHDVDGISNDHDLL